MVGLVWDGTLLHLMEYWLQIFIGETDTPIWGTRLLAGTLGIIGATWPLMAETTALAIPATFSISNGMALGIATYIGTKALGGRAGEISAVMWALGAMFLLRYLLLPVH